MSNPTSDLGFRWRYEHALEKSGLQPLTRLVLATIARRAKAKTGIIEGRFTPSAASLAEATGLSERRVRDHLKLAAEAGWLTLEARPGRKAGMAIKIPGTVDVANTGTIITPDDLASTPDAPSGVTPDAPSDGSDLIVQTKVQTKDHDARPRETIPPVDNPMSMMIIAELEHLTGETIPKAHALKVEAQILARASSRPSHPIPFVRAAIRREANPKNFLPTYTPPPVRRVVWQEQPRERLDEPVKFGVEFAAIVPPTRTPW